MELCAVRSVLILHYKEKQRMGKFIEDREKTLTQDKFIRRVAGSTGAMVKDADFWVKAIKKELIA